MSLAARTAALVVCVVGIGLNVLAAWAGRGHAIKPAYADPHWVELPVTPVEVPDRTLDIAPNDWEAVGKVRSMQLQTRSFRIDPTEVTEAAWARCVQSGSCPKLGNVNSAQRLPVALVSPSQAMAFCSHQGGRLPTRAEWMAAASSAEGNRYPWGQTGLVCRKAVFGMIDGPCGFGATGPAPVATHSLGATSSGIYDLSGNVAEWVTEGDTFFAVGGSFRSTLAGQLKVWAWEQTSQPRDDIGFRCVYQKPTLNE